jgi:arylamine N-acetyltransferase
MATTPLAAVDDLKDGEHAPFSIDAYLSRIGWPAATPLPKTAATVEQLHRLHSTAIPFDNFDFHIQGQPVCVDPAWVWPKVASGRRGTYCYQGNAIFTQALHLLGFRAALIPVSTWRPYAGSFTSLPSHCSVLIELDGQWLLADVATVDCIDGILEASAPLEVPQTVGHGERKARYRLLLVDTDQLPFTVPSAATEEVQALQEKYQRDVTLAAADAAIGVVLQKEEPQRDPHFDPLEPIEMHWLNRFAFRLPRRRSSPEPGSAPISAAPTTDLRTVAAFPHSVPWRLAELYVRHTATLDTHSHHWKQWVGIRYSASEKFIMAGFRFIQVQRPFSRRSATACAPATANNGELDPPEVVAASFSEVRRYLEDCIGIYLSPEELANLKIDHNYLQPKIEHVWSC